MKLFRSMKRSFQPHPGFLLASLLAGNWVVADDTHTLATGNKTTADARRVSPVQQHASATDASSATTSNITHTSGAAVTNTLPPLPPGVVELKFSEFFRQPIGPRGLDYTDRLRSLEGRRIRILGYMVRQDRPADHGFLLAPLPQTLHEEEYGLCDDLPATTLHVFTTPEAPGQTAFTPGLLLLTGKLRLGNRLELDGRTSTVRLELDPPTPDQQAAMARANPKPADAGAEAHTGPGR
jgi:hypothetical protein